MRQLDKIVGIEENAVLKTEARANEADQSVDPLPQLDDVTAELDRLIHYLRFVHSFCYYCGIWYGSETEILRKCGNSHVRPFQPSAGAVETKGEEDSNSEDEGKKNERAVSEYDQTWAATLSDRLSEYLSDEYSATSSHASVIEQRVFEDFKRDHIGQEADNKYRCRATETCNKLFKGEDFLTKHFKLKHADLLGDLYHEAKAERAFENYHNDPKKVTASDGPAPSTNAPLLDNPPQPVPSGASWSSRRSSGHHPPYGQDNLGPRGPADVYAQRSDRRPYGPDGFSAGGRRGGFSVGNGRGAFGGPYPYHNNPFIQPTPYPTAPPPPYGSGPPGYGGYGPGSGLSGGFPVGFGRPDPRGIRQYVDLDAPSSDLPVDYRTTIDYSDL